MFKKFTLLICIFSAFGCESNNVQSDADIILINGRVYTMQWEKSDSDGNISDRAPYENSWFPDASAVVISGNKITFVGSTSDAISKKNDESQIIDLAGAVVVPGLVDSHTHVFGVGPHQRHAYGNRLILERRLLLQDL